MIINVRVNYLVKNKAQLYHYKIKNFEVLIVNLLSMVDYFMSYRVVIKVYL